MKRQILAMSLVAALAAVPVRADDSLLYLAGRPVDSQMGSEQLRDRLKDFLSRSASVSAPIKRVAKTQDVAALSVEVPVPTESKTASRTDVALPHKELVPPTSEIMPPPEEIVLPPEVMVAALTADAFSAPIPDRQDIASPQQVLDSEVSMLVPEQVVLPPEVDVQVASLPIDAFFAPIPSAETTAQAEQVLDREIAAYAPEAVALPPEILVAALPADGFHAPIPVVADAAPLGRGSGGDIAAHVPEEIILPAGIQVAALAVDSLAAPIPTRTKSEAIAPKLALALPAVETTVDAAQVARLSERDRAVVFDSGDAALATLGLTSKTDAAAPGIVDGSIAEPERPLAGAGLSHMADCIDEVVVFPGASFDACSDRSLWIIDVFEDGHGEASD